MKKTWPLKVRAIVVSVGLALVFLLALATLIFTVLSGGFKRLELELVDRNVRRLDGSYNYILKNFQKKQIDWAEWDDTYEFIADLNDDYKKSNLLSSSLGEIDIDEMLFYDETGVLKHATAASGIAEKEGDFPGDMENFLIDNKNIRDEMTANKVSGGLIKTDNGTMIYSGHLILKSNGEGPSRGFIVFGRYIGNWLEDEISDIIQLPVVLDDTDVHNSSETNPIVITDGKIYAYFWLPVIGDTKKLGLQLEMDRDVWIAGQKNMNYLMFAAGIFALACAFGNYLVLYKVVLKDLLKFRNEVAEITRRRGEGYITQFGSNLEIDELRGDINTLLKELNDSKAEIENKAGESEKMNKLMIGRELKMIQLKKEIEEAKQKTNP